MQNEENKYTFSLRVFKEQKNKGDKGVQSQKATDTTPPETLGLPA
jgi:hypothetical protein